jgi:membrane protein involved in colicin uptake
MREDQSVSELKLSTVETLQLQTLLAERGNAEAYGQTARLVVIDATLERLGWVSPAKRAAAERKAAAEAKAADAKSEADAKAAADAARKSAPVGRSQAPQTTAAPTTPHVKG